MGHVYSDLAETFENIDSVGNWKEDLLCSYLSWNSSPKSLIYEEFNIRTGQLKFSENIA